MPNVAVTCMRLPRSAQSRGGSSLLSCWMLMAFLKGSDTRRSASFVVRLAGSSYEGAYA